MSEYWKSTERYWCKHCKIFVKDTKLDRTHHDLTPRHQGNLKRFVRDLHRTNERGVRDVQRAKDEVARLNGMVAGPSTSPQANRPSVYRAMTTNSYSRANTQDSHKAQLQQLADLGVSLPDEFRKELSMTGEWQTVSERLIQSEVEVKKDPEAIGYGVRKRANSEDEEDEEEKDTKRRRWEATHKKYRLEDDDLDLDALFQGDISIPFSTVKSELGDTPANTTSKKYETTDQEAIIPTFKKSPSHEEVNGVLLATIPAAVSASEDVIMFKKRGKKNIRQKS